jgi:DNA adenine methylase
MYLPETSRGQSEGGRKLKTVARLARIGGYPLETSLVRFEKLRPLLKWAGGKRWLVPYLRPLWEPQASRRLVEPLCGGLAVTFGLQPKRALLNDVNPHLINFYQQVKKGLRAEIIMENSKAVYYRHRERFNQLIKEKKWDTSEAALLFYYLNHTDYNGLCRFNDSGLFNVPFGRYTQINYVRDFGPYADALSDWRFTCGDFAKAKVEEDDFVYVDPPYDVEFRQYSAGGFAWDDQVRLAHWAADLGVPTVISNQATDRIVKLYRSLGFSLKFVEVPRFINCVGTKRGPVREVLGTKGVD